MMNKNELQEMNLYKFLYSLESENIDYASKLFLSIGNAYRAYKEMIDKCIESNPKHYEQGFLEPNAWIEILWIEEHKE